MKELLEIKKRFKRSDKKRFVEQVEKNLGNWVLRLCRNISGKL